MKVMPALRPARPGRLKLESWGAVVERYWLPVMVGLAVLSGLLLPLHLLATQRFHHDEALYATWALQIASGDDPWLAETPVDKPPLFLYIVAGAFRWLGATETAARIPSLLATAGVVLLTFWLGQRLYGAGVGAVAAWLIALSPFSILFAPTAFTDPLLAGLVLAGCVAAAGGRAAWAGGWLGLAIATKQQGVFFTPLPLVLLAFSTARFRPGSFLPQTVRFGLALLPALLPFIVWDAARGQPSAFLEASLTNYGGVGIDLAGFGERWTGFIELLAYGTGSRVLNVIFLAGCPLLLAWAWIGLSKAEPVDLSSHRESDAPYRDDAKNENGGVRQTYGPTVAARGRAGSSNRLFSEERPGRRAGQADWGIFLFCLIFLGLHALLSFQVWDRYLLGLMPLLALLLARILLLPWALWQRYRPGRQAAGQMSLRGAGYGLALAWLLAATLSGPVGEAVNGRYPIGSNSRALYGIEQVAAYLQGRVGADTTLYHHWLGTHWRFYLWDYPYDLQYWATPQALAAKAEAGHFIAFPAWRSDTEARLALFEAGFRLRELFRTYGLDGSPSIILYQIERLP